MLTQFENAGAQTLTLRHALLIYRAGGDGRSETVTSVHDVHHPEGGAPFLGAGRAPTIEFVQTLARELLGTDSGGWLPATVVAAGHERIAWWLPARRRPLLFHTGSPEVNALSGRDFACPPLLLRAHRRSLAVRALLEDRRPEPGDTLAAAPFPNTAGRDGTVCLGSVPRPEAADAAHTAAWEAAFFASFFTHAQGGIATSHPGGLTGLILEWAEADAFPAQHLARVRETAEAFVTGGRP